ncbi:hypothetical protein V5O48_019290 [Marasmius crinis-equi]|uniref:N-acetyltransferase domain-containing protein n=1 Tax=Marasmius crinis-equi TaxID=585013 RepID=A0ABR3EIV0_9AGAR
MAPIFARSFHPVSPYMVRAFPDTHVIESWWESVHNYSITSPDISIHVVTHGEHIVALARWRFSSSTWDTEEPETPGDLTSGTWSLIPLSSGHDEELCKSMIDFMGVTRKSYMSGRPHILLELVLCAHEYKGIGAGRLLVEQCIREADERGLEIFVETNGAIVKFYEKFGFKEKERVVMPGGYGYEEIILLRPTASSTE